MKLMYCLFFIKDNMLNGKDRGQAWVHLLAIHTADSGIINETTRDKMNKDRLPKW